MSQDIVKKVARQHPEVFAKNIAANNYQFLRYVIEALRAAGIKAEHVCKVSGEKQYTPPGFGRIQVTGFDGIGYTISGVSHDAIYIDDQQHDLIAAANHTDTPIPDVPTPVYAAVPRHEWRNWNPPLPSALEHGRPDVPTPQPPTSQPGRPPVLPDYASMGDAPFFIQVGNEIEADYKEGKQKLNGGAADWIARVVHSLMASFVEHGDHRNRDAIVKKHRNELREALKLKPLS